ncbi:hypothetical protein HUZ36_10375 [Pseudoalteromonas sp. McH1-7]|uniref:Copper chaperone PCu(A)C n=1 Tax=Pseudoalteromonas peptidolytica F12-50-A1 TaxID=1315280 RepID=A0A8I0N1E9_9GAMM|nr:MULTISPECIES: hypothetical protein [Pseudoalteromonas]MBE0349138.1 hypothetical protein [Pseudoalteromonas peptidolytica F12-50-A1]MDW7548957.1 hypothetical protein [Pseudoalteromonas peptidolytica]NLR16251.1 hypothetical protein [Pseudoalteromonas peptidolytica]NUZ11186.1 hypothetical protein [Pseudoalteromonas sp. McH1-7]RXF04343.1 hypothetical protein D9603_06125 [Pseudoalteromonas sp. PS5]
MYKRIMSALWMLLAVQSQAAEEALTIDSVVPSHMELAFPNDAKVYPDSSDFTVLNAVLMSNDSGERFATVTLKNQSSGRRTLTHKHLLALTANGQRIMPMELSEHFNGGETLSLTLSFGESKFPLLQVYTRN